jgi:hypothetical protein
MGFGCRERSFLVSPAHFRRSSEPSRKGFSFSQQKRGHNPPLATVEATNADKRSEQGMSFLDAKASSGERKLWPAVFSW